MPFHVRRVLILDENLSVPSDRRVWQEACALTRAGAEVTVVCPAGEERDQAPLERLEGVDIHRYLPRPSSGGIGGYFQEYGTALLAMRRFVQALAGARGFDVVHACNPPDLLLLAALSARRRGAAFVFDHHDLVPELFRSRFGSGRVLYAGTRAAERLTFALADVVISTNDSYRTIALTRGRKPANAVFVVRNAPDVRHLAEAMPDPALRENCTFLLVYAGIMGPQDGVDHALEALAHLRRLRTDWRALLVGDGDVLPAMRILAGKLGLDEQVRFTGWLDGERLRSTIRSADVCLAPDPSNPLNDRSTMVKIVEYMALARPIAAYDLPENRVSAGEAAAYAPPNDPEALARVVDALLDDPDRRAAMGAIGRARIERELSWENSERSLLAAYDRAFSIADARRTGRGGGSGERLR